MKILKVKKKQGFNHSENYIFEKTTVGGQIDLQPF